MNKPDWWPKNPYPESIFPMTTDEYVKSVPDEHLRSAISGCLARWAWGVASDMIWDRFKEHLEDTADESDT